MTRRPGGWLTRARARGAAPWVAVACLWLTLCVDVAGHAGSAAFWRVVAGERDMRAVILVALDDVHRLAPDVPTSPGPVDAGRLGTFGNALLTHFAVRRGASRLPSRLVSARVLPSGLLEVHVVHEASVGTGPLTLRATFHTITDDTHRVIASIERDGRAESVVFAADRPEYTLDDSSRRDAVPPGDAIAPAGVLASAVRLGVRHILTGYDHLVFLACLLIPGGTMRSRVGVVSAFTLAHSITLALAATGLIVAPAGFVEPAIAVSIAYVAIENLLGGPMRGRWLTAFGFGLIHGFGFAGMLGALELPAGQWLSAVAAFNIGVELGQLAVVVVAVPLVAALAATTWHRRVVQCASVSVLGLAAAWFVARLP